MTDRWISRTIPARARKRIAQWIMRAAMSLTERIDRDECPKVMGFSFTFEPGYGIVFRDDGRGCQLAYLRDADYDRAHTEGGPIINPSPMRHVWIRQPNA